MSKSKCTHSQVLNIKTHSDYENGDYETGYCPNCDNYLKARPPFNGAWEVNYVKV